ncbi:hypothetical protein ACEWY4_010202 [Coilia grayii]|uniref:DUF4806 domain-containing protein n=1 Tax=Coilia grayii TaxID=363190 RepID=A0ABD1K8L3_9TELE
MCYNLIKIKMTSAKRRECAIYNLTSQTEEEAEEDVPIKTRRERTKRGIPDDFVTQASTDSEGEDIRAAQLPSYPKAPEKLPPIQDRQMVVDRSPYSGNHGPGQRLNPGDRSRDRSRSRHGGDSRRASWSRSRSRHRGHSRRPSQSRSRSRSQYGGGSRLGRSSLDAPRHADVTSSYDRPGHDADSPIWTYPMPKDAYQKRVINMLATIVEKITQALPASSTGHIDMMETMEDFEREEQRLSDKTAFDALVVQLSRIGGKDTKDCVHKVLDKLFTNGLMAKFNMKGKGKMEKRPLEKTLVYKAIKDGVMKFDSTATEGFVRQCAADHLKHAAQRRGGGGHGTQN